jgi:mono/diheme cytochrome c family protein
MRRVLPGMLLTWVLLPGCANTDSDLPRPYRRLEVPAAVLASPDAQRRGRTLYVVHCQICHGERGDGQGVRREGLTPPPRDFTNPAWHRSASPRHVFFAIREGRPGTPMPGWKILSEKEAWDLTAYVLSFGAEPQR